MQQIERHCPEPEPDPAAVAVGDAVQAADTLPAGQGAAASRLSAQLSVQL